jgi:hypothetical protein
MTLGRPPAIALDRNMRSTALLFGLLAAIPAQAIAADQFDLICTAKKEVQHYRLDLTRMEYCWSDCRRVQKIQEVTSGFITFFKIEPKYKGDEEGWNTVNRVTGEWSWFNANLAASLHIQDIRGSCEAAPFSGLPEAVRKF